MVRLKLIQIIALEVNGVRYYLTVPIAAITLWVLDRGRKLSTGALLAFTINVVLSRATNAHRFHHSIVVFNPGQVLSADGRAKLELSIFVICNIERVCRRNLVSVFNVVVINFLASPIKCKVDRPSPNVDDKLVVSGQEK
jgi:hypothetical protein